jgi:hypothetical protein
MNDRLRAIILPLAVAVTAMGVHAGSLQNDFILDDAYLARDNPLIRDITNIPSFFTSPLPAAINQNFYRPVFLTSLAIDHAVGGGNPGVFHFTNVLIHGIVAALVFLLALRILGDPKAAAVAALLFSLHPVHGEAVSIVTYRAGTLSAMFALLALLMHSMETRTRAAEIAARVATAVLAFLAMASKDDGVVVGGLLFLYDFALGRCERTTKRIWRLVPVALVTVGYLAIRAAVCSPTGITYFGSTTAGEVLRTVTVVQVVALGLLVAPFDLTGTWHEDMIARPGSWMDVRFLGAALVMALVLGVAGFCWRRARIVSFGILFHFVAMVPTFQIVRLPVLFGERFLYLASVGFCIILARGFQRVIEQPRWKVVAMCAASSVFAVFGGLTVLRGPDYRNDLAFWSAAVRDRPKNIQAHVGLGMTLAGTSRCEEASSHFAFVAASGNGDSASARAMRVREASCFLRIGRKIEAVQAAEAYLARYPGDGELRALRDAALNLPNR